MALVAWALRADPHWAERHVLRSYCATGRTEWVMAHALPWLAAALGAVALELARALARWIGRTPPGARWRSIVAIAAAVAAALGVTELYLRRVHDRLTLGGRPPAGHPELAMTRADSRLGWTYFPGRTTSVRMGDRRIAYAIDADGDRASSSGDVADPDLPTVLFAGESIAFGYGLPWEETFPFLVGRDLGVQVVNRAVVGYGNDQAYLRLLDALPRYRRPLAVVTVFIPDQMKRNVDVWRARLALSPDGALTPVAPAGGPRLAKLLQELPYRSGEALRVTAAILRATAEAARASGALPLFVVTNYGPACIGGEHGEPWVLDELFVRQALPFVRVDLGPEDRLPGLFENHPNLHGTRKIAAAVERALSSALGIRMAGPTEAPNGR